MKVKILNSDRKDKKFKAVFYYVDPLRIYKTIHFGGKGYEDYTTMIDKDDNRKENYLKRHHDSHENWFHPFTAGALSRWILWNKKTLEESIEDFKQRYNLG